MPVFFYIDPEFATDRRLRNVDHVTLSYVFFRTGDVPTHDDGTPLTPGESMPAHLLPSARAAASVGSSRSGSSSGARAGDQAGRGGGSARASIAPPAVAAGLQEQAQAALTGGNVPVATAAVAGAAGDGMPVHLVPSPAAAAAKAAAPRTGEAAPATGAAASQ
jgi:Cytochrome c oxidase assembly protein CtaG/Cox11